ncbi:PAS domain S-box protein [Pseudomonas cedrina]|uniref:PAS domain S-box protein n=1 Tax=Pseudomonas cedrina TaxID=651740 RepID=UPI0027D8FC67|nr:PAS domain S-box protein [Pseudomonas cedrina]
MPPLAEFRKDEEPDILRRIRLGERIEHYETFRRRKDGSLVEISLSVSPVKNREGRIIGAAKIARDITDRRQSWPRLSPAVRPLTYIPSFGARSTDPASIENPNNPGLAPRLLKRPFAGSCAAK